MPDILSLRIPVCSGWVGRHINVPALLAISLAGANVLFVKLILRDGLSPVAVTTLRITLGAAVLFAMLMATEKNWGVAIRDLPGLALIGISGQAISQLAFVEGLNYTTAGNVSVLLSTSPMFTAMIVASMGLEKLRWKTAGGIVLGFAGIALVAQKDGFSFEGGAILGDLFCIASALAWSIYMVAQTPLLRRYSMIKVMAYSAAFGALVTLPPSWQEVASQPWLGVSPQGWAFFFCYVLLSGAALTLLWGWAIRDRGAANTNVYSLLNPVYGIVLGVAFLGETTVPVQIAGVVAVLAGLALANL